MAKKQPAKKRQRSSAQRRAKPRPRIRTDAYVTEDQAIGSGMQSGDSQGLSGVADANFESVKELSEEGQYLEAEVVDGVETATDERPVKTKEVPENDVPLEYRIPNRERQS